MTRNQSWIRVGRQNPCGICGKSDWCCVGEKYWCCMRVESSWPCKNGGWFHPLDEASSVQKMSEFRKPIPEIRIDAQSKLEQWKMDTGKERLDSLSRSLGVSTKSLMELEAAWAEIYDAWAFPMKNGNGEKVGIRLRNEEGKKWAVTGSRNGIFIPDCDHQSTVFLCEGPTDTAAALSIGLYAIGRPSCSCGVEEIKTTMARLKIKVAVVVSDNDDAGLQGATKLLNALKVRRCMFIPPAKDMRDFVKSGGTKQVVDSILRNLVWTK